MNSQIHDPATKSIWKNKKNPFRELFTVPVANYLRHITFDFERRTSTN